MKKESSFLKYLEANFSERIFEYSVSFLRGRVDLIEQKFHQEHSKIYNIEIEDMRFHRVYTQEKNESELTFDIVVRVDVTFEYVCGKYHDHDSDGVSDIWLKLSCSGKIGSDLENFFIHGVDEYSPEKYDKPLSGDLVPIISSKEYGKQADVILQKYYPEVLKSPCRVDPALLAHKMGLNVIERNISIDKTIFGQIFFKETEFAFSSGTEIVPAKTVIVDKASAFLRSYGSPRLTIAHECVHYFLHQKAFRFAQMVNNNLNFIQCLAVGGLKEVGDDSPALHMEIQANGIAPYLLMPTTQFTIKVEQLLREYSAFNENLLDSISLIINDLAEFYGVTKYAARNRMIDVGFEIAIGAYNWIDDGFVPSYSFALHSLADDETYVISRVDLAQVIKENSLFNATFLGSYVFVENHLVLNDKKFVDENEHGRLVLTLYGRSHVDECCLKFRFIVKKSFFSNNSKTLATFCYLCREAQFDINYDMTIAKHPAEKESPEFKEKVQQHQDSVKQFRSDTINMNLSETLSYLSDKMGLPHNVLEFRTGLSERTMRRYLNGGSINPKKETLIAICLAGFRLAPDQITEIMKKAGLALANSAEDNNLLLAIQTMRGQGISEINDFLVKLGNKPLVDTDE